MLNFEITDVDIDTNTKNANNSWRCDSTLFAFIDIFQKSLFAVKR